MMELCGRGGRETPLPCLQPPMSSVASASSPPQTAADTATGVMAQILADEDCCEYEEELQHNPYSLTLWMRYLDAQKSASTAVRTMLFERALLLCCLALC